jgi:hypothetical protein
VTACELPELIELERIIEEGAGHLDARVLCQVTARDQQFPVYSITLGNPSPDVPAVGFFAMGNNLTLLGQLT